jgi:hypothetical protein
MLCRTEKREASSDLSSQLKYAFLLPPLEGVQLLHSVIVGLFALIETHVTEFDTRPYIEKVQQRRGVWDHAPGT